MGREKSGAVPPLSPQELLVREWGFPETG